MAERKTSVTLIVFGIINIVIALVPPCVGVGGAMFFFQDQHLPVRNQDLGPAMKQHIDKELAAARYEAIGAALCNSFLSLLLIAGAIALFTGQEWGRWLTIGAAVLMMLTFCIHDVYQLAVVRPSLMEFLDRNLPQGGPPGEREGFKIGFSGSFFCWSCSNPLILIYLMAMSICTGLIRASSEVTDEKLRRLARFDTRGDDRRIRERDRFP
jgi:cytochrome c biogenesis protein CcdA